MLETIDIKVCCMVTLSTSYTKRVTVDMAKNGEGAIDDAHETAYLEAKDAIDKETETWDTYDMLPGSKYNWGLVDTEIETE